MRCSQTTGRGDHEQGADAVSREGVRGDLPGGGVEAPGADQLVAEPRRISLQEPAHPFQGHGEARGRDERGDGGAWKFCQDGRRGI